MRDTSLVALVVTYNRLSQLKTTLARLLDAPEDVLRAVVVFDNASDDGTAEWLAAHPDPRLDVIRSASNTGGAGGFDAGMRAAVDRHDPDWLVLMDDDARPAPGALAAFVDMDRTSHAAWVSAVLYSHGDICDMNRPLLNPFGSPTRILATLLRGREGFHIGADGYGAEAPRREVDGGSFVGLFVSRDGIARAGYPDGRLFIYGDDTLFSLALRRAGGRICFDPALRFEHDCDTLQGDAARRISPLWKVYYYHRNLTLVYRAAAGPVLFWPALAARALMWAWRGRRYPAGPERRSYYRLLRMAVRDGVRRDLRLAHADVLRAAAADQSRSSTSR